MSGTVIGIGGKAVAFGEPVAEIVKLLEDVLEEAKTGRLRAVAIASVRQDYAFNAHFALSGPYTAAMIGACALCLRRATDEA